MKLLCAGREPHVVEVTEDERCPECGATLGQPPLAYNGIEVDPADWPALRRGDAAALDKYRLHDS